MADKNSSGSGLFDALGRASVMGLHMVSGIIVGGLLGYWLDRTFDASPWFLLGGIVFGIGAGFRNLWLDAKILLRHGENTSERRKDADKK